MEMIIVKIIVVERVKSHKIAAVTHQIVEWEEIVALIQNVLVVLINQYSVFVLLKIRWLQLT
jgi:hypothetical protein